MAQPTREDTDRVDARGRRRSQPRLTHRLLVRLVIALGVLSVLGMVVLSFAGGAARPDPDAASESSALVDATLVEVTPVAGDDLSGLPPGAVEVDVTARLEETGELVTFRMVDDTGDTFQPGQRVKLTAFSTPGQPVTYGISDFQRGRPLALLTVLFVGAVIGFGRLQGARALIGLVVTAVVVVGFLVPTVLEGASPVATALTASLGIMIATLYLSHGVSPKTTAAAVGTAAALLLTGLLAALFVGASNITGMSSEEARLANLEAGGLSLRGLLLAGIILGGLGVLDDVTVSQSSTVFALYRADPDTTFGALTRRALTVGRDHIAATVNTLFLAYAGASLPLLILFATGIDPLGTVLTSEIVAVEVVRTLVGSVGLIAAVPLTTALAAALALGDPEAAEAAEPGVAGPDAPPGRAPRPPEPRPRHSAEEDEEWVERLRDANRRAPGPGSAPDPGFGPGSRPPRPQGPAGHTG